MNFFSLILSYLLLAAGSTLAQEKAFVSLEEESIEIGEEDEYVSMTIPFRILDGYHIQLPEPKDENLIPSKLEIDSFEVLEVKFEASNETIILGNSELDVLSDLVKVNVRFKANGVSKALVRGNFYYQPCDNRKCYFPRRLPFEIQL